MKRYYRSDDIKAISDAKSFKDLFDIADNVLNRMPKPVIQVCGPISSGGKGNVEENLKVFENAINFLIKEGHNVFCQLPFEGRMVSFVREYRLKNPNEEYCFDLLNYFYLPIFESGKIHKLAFIPGWQNSVGSRWEREQGVRLGLEIFDLPEDCV